MLPRRPGSGHMSPRQEITVNRTTIRGVTWSLHTDHYELTMVQAALAGGIAARPCVFSAFARRVPGDAPYGVVGGVDAALDAITSFRFTDEDLAALEGVLDGATLELLAAYRFGGDVEVVDDGELYFADEPVLTVTGTFAEAVALETVVLSHLNGSCGVATAAARMRAAAGNRLLSEQGSRRVHPEAAVAAARAAYVAGFDSTSNLAAGVRYGIPTMGTAAHSWTLLHATDEQAAFETQLRALGPDTTLLVDTFGTRAGIDRAMAAARVVHGRPGPGAIRIDSGDLRTESVLARQQLDAGGATRTRIVVSGEVDDDLIRDLAGAPVDGFGVGTNVVIAPSPGFVYKLVATDVGDGWVDVAKTSPAKATTGGRRVVCRCAPDGHATVPLAPDRPATDAATGGRLVTRRAVARGEVVRPVDPITATAEARRRHAAAVREHQQTPTPGGRP